MSLPLSEVTLVRCTPAQGRQAVLNDPPEATEDIAVLVSRAEVEPDGVMGWALVPAAHPETTELLSHCVTWVPSQLV